MTYRCAGSGQRDHHGLGVRHAGLFANLDRAHGSGSADRLVVDEWDHVWVPPEAAASEVRRLWITPEEDVHYYDCSNEELEPLCHLASVRPISRSSDWRFYNDINERFAAVIINEARRTTPSSWIRIIISRRADNRQGSVDERDDHYDVAYSVTQSEAIRDLSMGL